MDNTIKVELLIIYRKLNCENSENGGIGNISRTGKRLMIEWAAFPYSFPTSSRSSSSIATLNQFWMVIRLEMITSSSVVYMGYHHNFNYDRTGSAERANYVIRWKCIDTLCCLATGHCTIDGPMTDTGGCGDLQFIFTYSSGWLADYDCWWCA